MMPHFAGRRPTENAAVGRTRSRPAPTAPVTVLRHRLLGALGRADGAGALLLAHHLRRAAG